MLLYQKVFEIFVGFSVLPIFYYEFNLLYRIDEYNASTIKPAPIKPVIISDTSINVPTYIYAWLHCFNSYAHLFQTVLNLL